MPEVKWIKLLTEMFDDEKIKLIEAVPEADMLLVIWIKLLTLAGKKNMNGYIFLTENIPYTDEMLSTLFNRPLNTVRLALETFKKFGMICFNNEGQIKISNWERHQNIDGLERIREQGRIRQEKFRDKLKLLSLKEDIDKNRGVTLHNVTKEKKISFSFKDEKFLNLTLTKMEVFEEKYPDKNVYTEIEKMEKWLMAEKVKKDNKERNKIPKDYNSFIHKWLGKE